MKYDSHSRWCADLFWKPFVSAYVRKTINKWMNQLDWLTVVIVTVKWSSSRFCSKHLYGKFFAWNTLSSVKHCLENEKWIITWKNVIEPMQMFHIFTPQPSRTAVIYIFGWEYCATLMAQIDHVALEVSHFFLFFLTLAWNALHTFISCQH